MKTNYIKTIILVVLIAALIMSGCAKDNTKSNASGQGGNNAASVPQKTDFDYPTAADYYQYLNDIIKSSADDQRASSSNILLDIGLKELSTTSDVYMAFWNNCSGNIGAIAQDFNDDGALEFISFVIRDVSDMDTRFSSALYDSSVTEFDPYHRSLELWLDYYAIKYGGESIERGSSFSHEIIYMPLKDYGSGFIVLGIEKLDDAYYLYSYSYSGMRTGRNYYSYSKIPGSFPCYLSSVDGEIYLSEEDANKLVYIDDPLDFTDTSLPEKMDAINTVIGQIYYPQYYYENPDDIEEKTLKAALEEVLGDGILCLIQVDYMGTSGHSDLYNYEVTDYTNLRHYLENNAEDWTPPTIPQGGGSPKYK